MTFKNFFRILYFLVLTSGAYASGWQISEYSSVNLGRSFAGAGVMGDDFSAIGYNPAGMQYAKTNGLQLGATEVIMRAHYNDRQYQERRHSTMARMLPQFFAQYRLNDKLVLGSGIYTPYGLITDYPNDWSSSKHGTLSELKAVDLSTGFSYELTPLVALGFSLNGQYAQARLTSSTTTPYYSANDLDGDNINAGYSLGLTLNPTQKLRLGLSYRSKVVHNLEGDMKMNLPYTRSQYDISAKITTPELVIISGAYDFSADLTLSATARWTHWTRFKNLNIIAEEQVLAYPQGTPLSSTNENWKNTWFFSLGADYQMTPNWTIRSGVAYDQSVIKSPEYRTVRIPDGRRIFLSGGISYRSGNWQYDLSYAHVWMKHSDAYGSEKGKPAPDIHYNRAGASIASIGIQYKF